MSTLIQEWANETLDQIDLIDDKAEAIAYITCNPVSETLWQPTTNAMRLGFPSHD